MNILQHIVFPNTSIYAKDVGLYLNASTDVRIMDNVLIVPPYQKVDFDTYFNYFAVKKWMDFGQIDSLYVKGNIKGVVLLEIIGVKKYQNFIQQTLLLGSKIGTTNEWLDYHQEIEGFESYDGIFVRICTLNEQCELGMLEFGTYKPIRQQVKLGICAFGTNNPRVFNEINQMAQCNGLCIDFFNYNVNNQNQIISIIKCLSESQVFDGTHILTLSTDGYVSSESIFRAVRFFEMVFLERRDVLLVGHRLLDDNNNAKELVNPIDFVLKGGSKNNTLDWSFCMFDKALVQGYGLPLPILPEYSAVEYQQRIYKEIVPINGVAFFDIKIENKSIVQAEYYDVRDSIICELLETNPKLSKIKILIWNRFWKNIHTYQYIGARLNLYALDHIIKGTYQKDLADIDRFVDNLYQRESKFVRYTYIDVQKYAYQQDDANEHTLLNKVSPYFGIGKKSVVGKCKVLDFWGKTTVVVADTNGEARIARVRRKKAAILIAHATKSYCEFVKNHKQIKRTLLWYRNNKKRC